MPLFSRDRLSSITKADLARGAGDWKTAANHYTEALSRNPARPEIWVQYGHALKEGGNLAAAEAAYCYALGYDRCNADSHLQLGHALKLQGKTEEAQSAYLRAFALRPTWSEPIRELRELGWASGPISELAEPHPARTSDAATVAITEQTRARAGGDPHLGQIEGSYIPSSGHLSLRSRIQALGLFDPEVYLSIHDDLRQAKEDGWRHFIGCGLDEGRTFTNPEIVARRLAELEVQLRKESRRFRCEAQEILTRGGTSDAAYRLRQRGTRIGVYCSSEGNFFMQEIAELLIWGLQSAGIDAVYRNETASKEENFDFRIFVAPHEFFYLGSGIDWTPLAGLKNSVLYNVEQAQTPWFCRAIPLLLKAPLILEINFQTAALLKNGGCNVVHFMPGYLSDCRYIKPVLDVSDIALLNGYCFAKKTLNWQEQDRLDDRPIDILFIGSAAQRRDSTLTRLAELSESYRFVCVYTHQTAPLNNRTYRSTSTAINCALGQRAKIVLNIHRDWLGYFEWSRMVLQGFWQGSCVVSDFGLPNPIFDPGTHYLEESARHLGELIHWLLDSADGRQKLEEIRHAGWQRAKELGSMKVALSPVLSALEELYQRALR